MLDASDPLLRDPLSPMRVRRKYREIVTPEGEMLRFRGVMCFEEVYACPRCGYALPTMARPDNWKFCPTCGQAIVLRG